MSVSLSDAFHEFINVISRLREDKELRFRMRCIHFKEGVWTEWYSLDDLNNVYGDLDYAIPYLFKRFEVKSIDEIKMEK